jgi:hypothetical protein
VARTGHILATSPATETKRAWLPLDLSQFVASPHEAMTAETDPKLRFVLLSMRDKLGSRLECDTESGIIM